MTEQGDDGAAIPKLDLNSLRLPVPVLASEDQMIQVWLYMRFPDGEEIHVEDPIGLVMNPDQVPDLLRSVADLWGHEDELERQTKDD